MRTGTMTLDQLAADPETPLEQIGIEAAAEAVQRELDIHNDAVREQADEFAEITTDVQRVDAAQGEIGEMSPLTETGRAPSQIVERGNVTVGFPLEGWQYPIGWTQRALDQATGADIATQVRGAEEAHIRKLQARLKQAFYGATNFTVRDYLSKNKIDLAVKRFYNADGWPIPMGPNGEVFDGATHSHYLAGALAAALLMALIDTVREHRPDAEIRVVIALEDEPDVSALDGFKPYTDPALTLIAAGDVATQRLDMSNPSNRAIGRFHGAEVWVKPWAIGNYALAYAMTGPRPLALRVPKNRGGMPALRLAAENRQYPMLARFMESEFGFGAMSRASAAILYFGGGGTYVVPAING